MNGLWNELLIAAHGVWRRRWIALGVAWGLALVGWLVIAMIPNSYESRARVFVVMQSLLSDKIGISEADQQRDIDRVRQTLTSGENLEKVVRATDLAGQALNPKDMAATIEALRKDITVKAQQDNLFEISAVARVPGFGDARNAKLAREVVQKLIDIFVAGDVDGDRSETTDTLKFLDAELARRQAQLDAADQKRAQFEQQYMGMLPGTGTIQQRMDAARTELASIDMQLIGAQSSLNAMSGQLASTPATIANPAAAGGPSGAAGRIAGLEGQLADAAAKGWTDQHPDVIAIRGQIGRLRALPQSGGGTGAGTMQNPSYVALRSMQAEKQGIVAALQSRKAQLAGDMAAFTTKQTDEPGVAAEQTQLDRDYQVLKTQYDKLLTDREDVRLRQDVATKTDAVQFRVIDPPSAPQLPSAPKRPLLLFAVLIVAVGAGIATAFALSQLRTTYATPERLAAAVELPVLGRITEVTTPAGEAEAQRRLRWFAGGSGALAACFALLMIVEFVRRGLVA